MQNKAWLLLGLIALVITPLSGQPTNGAVYWSATQPDCSSLNETAFAIKNAAGKTIGYSCYVSGTFVWLAAGGGSEHLYSRGCTCVGPHRCRLHILRPEWKQTQSRQHAEQRHFLIRIK